MSQATIFMRWPLPTCGGDFHNFNFRKIVSFISQHRSEKVMLGVRSWSRFSACRLCGGETAAAHRRCSARTAQVVEETESFSRNHEHAGWRDEQERLHPFRKLCRIHRGQKRA